MMQLARYLKIGRSINEIKPSEETKCSGKWSLMNSLILGCHEAYGPDISEAVRDGLRNQCL